ncbi:cation:dicarboxylase symporter family transporter [Leptolyngbya sp. FACHB-711]|uniref:dicarboxylate/amino acid:cation symporter n=1 Tax=unclassified Leptolyngbya TaxID=2650499 RepID=UPI001683BA80|nr:cation:dicarboxylase symporter family transporter [Leptolyngbya sp. FACHB-711]MBD1851357.1 cation:dicarboxylase symporter family transporter [Cyanobacteria bacterium FACHB-502]MBD2023677.1 cation:dicarboxylase symporter family transporter [Leptolyngbya sp. FACHB-711]
MSKYFSRYFSKTSSNYPKFFSVPFLIRWLKSPWTIAVSVGLSIYLGTCQPQIAASIAPLGQFYLSLLKMCVLPILLSAVTVSTGRLMMTDNAARSIRRIAAVFPIGLLLVSSIAVAIATLAQPGKNLSASALKKLGILVNQSGIDLEISLSGAEIQPEEFPLNQLLVNLIPENIFSALSEGQTLRVLVFALVFGISLGLVREPATQSLFAALESVYHACNRLIQGLTVLLPLGLCSLLTTQFSQLGIDILFSMIRFVLIAILTFVIIYILSTIIIWRQTNQSFLTVLAQLKESTFLALATSSSLACIPSAISALSNGLGFDRQTTQLLTPLSITLCRFGSVIYFALAALFVAQLYNKDLSGGQLALVVVLSILAGMATSGATSVITLTMLDIVLNPLKLPLEAVLVLFIAIDPIVDPFRTLGIVHTGIAATALVAQSEAEPRIDISTLPPCLPDSTL